jgi:hypothetical protein
MIKRAEDKSFDYRQSRNRIGDDNVKHSWTPKIGRPLSARAIIIKKIVFPGGHKSEESFEISNSLSILEPLKEKEPHSKRESSVSLGPDQIKTTEASRFPDRSFSDQGII